MIKIIEPGLYSSIQDQGRENFKKYGVPVSGCMDSKSSNFANFLFKLKNKFTPKLKLEA